MADRSRALLIRQQRPQRLVHASGVRPGVELIKVNGIHPQRPQRRFELPARAGWREVLRPVQELVEVMAELGGDDPPRAVPPAEVIADQPLRQVVPVTFGGVNEVDPQLRRLVQDRVHVGLRKAAAPLAAKLPGADPDD